MSLFNLFLVYSILMATYIYCSVREHLLIVLLSLEFMVLVIYLFMILGVEYFGGYYALVYLVMGACEGALGLSILIIMGRNCGGDYLKGVSALGVN